MRIIIGFIFIYLALLNISCKSPNTEKINQINSSKKINLGLTDTISFNYGVVHKEIKIIADNLQSYTLYLPSYYKKEQQWPVIYFFDSHAAGNLPIEKYKTLSEKYGYIIVGSNNSKNGQALDLCNDIIQKFIADVAQRFSIDKKRMYTAGFSGGARVAVTAAMSHADIAGVIGCGAGFPNTNESLQRSFEFIGIVGNADFNFAELNKLDNTLEEQRITHQLLIFNGKHEWPDEITMEQAYWWIECNAMRQGRRSVDKSIIEAVKQTVNNELSKAQKENNLLDTYFISQKANSYLNKLDDVSQYENNISALTTSGKLQQILLDKAASEKSETLVQQQYATAFTNHDWAWWSKEIDKIYQIAKSSKNTEESIIHKRLLSYLSLVAYMYSTKAIQVNQMANAEIFLRIYEKVDPENSEHAYLFAQLYMKQNNSKNALKYLNKAVKLGFKDKERLLGDPVLASLKGQVIFDE